jgi:predicted transcriptional regulator
MATSLRLPPNLEADLKQLAKEHERSDHGEMIYALRLYVKQQKRTKAMEAKRTDEWAEGMLNAAVDEMDKKGIPATPESFSKYFQENYDLSWTPEEAKSWLEAQDWYQK